MTFAPKIRVATFGLCLAVLLSTPFETLGPILSLPGQNLTNLELLVALAVGLWAASGLIDRRLPRWKTKLTALWILLLLIMAASTALAPEHRQNALHFTGRCAAGFLFFLVVLDLADSRRRIAWMLTATTCAGTLVGLLGLLEYFRVPAALDLLTAFQAGPSYAVGQTRVSSTLQYSTIASMYLEIVFALGLGLLLLAMERRKRVLTGVLLVSLWVIGTGAILTLTRGGLLSLAMTLALVGIVCYREVGIDDKVIAVGILAAGLGVSLVATTFDSQEARLRLTTVNQRDWYKAEYEVPSTLYLRSGEVRQVEIRLRNTGLADWNRGDASPFRLAYHWLSEDGSQVLDWEGIRTELPRPLPSGEESIVSARIQAPFAPGDYLLAWDVLQEHRFWFSKESSASATTRVEVRGEAPVPDHAELPVSTLPKGRLLIGRKELWRIAARMVLDHPWRGVGPDNFRLLYGQYAHLKTFDLTYHTHNTALEFFVNTGFAGGIVFLSIVWILIRLCRENCVQSSGENLALALGVTAAVVSILTHGLFDYFFEFTPTYLSIFTVFALAVAVNRLEKRNSGVAAL